MLGDVMEQIRDDGHSFGNRFHRFTLHAYQFHQRRQALHDGGMKALLWTVAVGLLVAAATLLSVGQLNGAEGAALALGDRFAALGESAHVRFIDHRVGPRHARRPIVAPVVTIVDDDRLRQVARAVAAIEGQIAFGEPMR